MVQNISSFGPGIRIFMEETEHWCCDFIHTKITTKTGFPINKSFRFNACCTLTKCSTCSFSTSGTSSLSGFLPLIGFVITVILTIFTNTPQTRRTNTNQWRYDSSKSRCQNSAAVARVTARESATCDPWCWYQCPIWQQNYRHSADYHAAII